MSAGRAACVGLFMRMLDCRMEVGASGIPADFIIGQNWRIVHLLVGQVVGGFPGLVNVNHIFILSLLILLRLAKF